MYVRSKSCWSERSKKSGRIVLRALVFTQNILENWIFGSYEKHDVLKLEEFCFIFLLVIAFLVFNC